MLKQEYVSNASSPSKPYFRRASTGGASGAVPLYVTNVQSNAFSDAGQRAYLMATGASVGGYHEAQRAMLASMGASAPSGYHVAKQAQTAHYDAAAKRAYAMASGASVSGTMAEAKKALADLHAKASLGAMRLRFNGPSVGAMKMRFPSVGAMPSDLAAQQMVRDTQTRAFDDAAMQALRLYYGR